MRYRFSAGPSGTASWKYKELGGGSRPSALTRLAAAGDAAGDDPSAYYCLPAAPYLAYDDQHTPMLHFSLILDRQPRVDDAELELLVRSGRLSFTLSLETPDELLAALSDDDGATYHPLFAQQIQAALEDAARPETPITTADGAGANARIAISATLDREQALQAWTAIRGEPSGLRVRLRLSYRTAPAAQEVRLSGGAAAIHDAAKAFLNRGNTIWLDDLRACFAEMVRDGTMKVEPPVTKEGAEAEATLEPLFRTFVGAATFVFTRVTTDLDRWDGRNQFALRARPHPAMQLNLRETIEDAVLHTIERTTPLEELLGGAIPPDGISILVSSDHDGILAGRLPRVTRTRRMSPLQRSRGNEGRIELAATDGKLQSFALALTPDTSVKPSARNLLGSDAVRLGKIQHARHKTWLADDIVHDVVAGIHVNGEPAALSLPVITDGTDGCWPDRVKSGSFWYVPEWTLVQPEPSADPLTSLFLFTFEQSSVTVGDGVKPALIGSVRFTLQPTMSPATEAELGWRGQPTVRPVPLDNLSVSLELPFRDLATGQPTSRRLAGRVEPDGQRYRVTIDLINESVRLCYGALAYPGFTDQPARLLITYGYPAYMEVPVEQLDMLYGGKIAMLAVAQKTVEVPDPVVNPVFNAEKVSLHLPSGLMQFKRDAPRGRPMRSREAPGSIVSVTKPIGTRGGRAGRPLDLHATAITAIRPTTFAHVALANTSINNAALTARPQMELSPAILERIRLRRYARRTIVEEASVDALVPCETLGGLYQQITDGVAALIGCQDAFRLGEASPRQYEEEPQLQHERYAVYRSLRQPGRFLVVPKRYRITRFGASEPPSKAFRPAVMIYALLHEIPTDNRYVFRATLQPDIPVWARRALEQQLVTHTPHGHTPVVDYPTDAEVAAETRFDWLVPDGLSRPEIQQFWDRFEVNVSTGIANALLLTEMIDHDGLTGKATFKLSDATEVFSDLVLDTQIVGPWATGPVTVTLTGAQAALHNMIPQTVNVFDLVVRRGGAEQTMRVDLSLAPGAVQAVPLESPADDAYVVYEMVPEDLKLKQLDIFVEDILTNVLFINLVNYANHGLAQLRLQVRLRGAEQIYAADIGENQSVSVEMTLPLTTYLESQTIEFQVTKIPREGSPTMTPWMPWDLAAQQNVISLDWRLIDPDA